jgi:hypothetical protein
MSTGAQIVAEFVSALGEMPGFSIAHSGVSQNVWVLDGSVQCLLYVKGRGESPYRWGVTANVVQRLKREKRQWFTILLYNSKDTGYLLSSADVLYYVKTVWPLVATVTTSPPREHTFSAMRRLPRSMSAYVVYARQTANLVPSADAQEAPRHHRASCSSCRWVPL